MNYSFELNNAMSGSTRQVSGAARKNYDHMIEICSDLFWGKDISKYGTDVDVVSTHLKKLGDRASKGIADAMIEISEIVKYVIQPKLTMQMKVFDFLGGHYQEIRADQEARIKTYTYEGIEARNQANGGDVVFGGRTHHEQTVSTHTISAGMAINYRELASGNFDGTIAEETAQVMAEMNNKGVVFVLETLKNALKNATGVKFYETYSDKPTQAGVDAMLEKMHHMGRCSILADYGVLREISKWTGYETVGNTVLNRLSDTMKEEFARTGLNGFYAGGALVEIENPYNFNRPLADKSGFETYYAPGDAYFIASNNGPLWIFKKGGLSTITGNDIHTGDVMTRFDMELGADVVKGREYEIGFMGKA